MRTYVILTGVVFALLTVAHVLRIFVEPHLIRDPWFIGATLFSAVLALTAWAVARRPEALRTSVRLKRKEHQ